MKRFLILPLILTALLLLLPGCAELVAATPSESGEIEIVMTDYNFQPDVIRLQAGQTVTLVLHNEGDKMHEFMAGRNINIHDGMTEGFAVDFFSGITPEITGPGMVMGIEGMDMDMEGMDMGEDDHEDSAEMDGMDMGEDDHDGGDEHGEGEEASGKFGPFQRPLMDAHAGLMVMIDPPTVAPSSKPTRVTFTVPTDKVGTWTFGCFQEQGQHFDDGMEGTLIVAPSGD
jgi:plastocyanin